MAAICLMRNDRLSAPLMSCLLFPLSFLSGAFCQTCVPELCVATWQVRQFSSPSSSVNVKRLTQESVIFPFISQWCLVWCMLFCGLLVLQRHLYAGWVVVWVFNDSGLKSEVSQWYYICCWLCLCNINSSEWFVNMWSNVRTLSRTFSTFIHPKLKPCTDDNYPAPKH